MKLSTTLVVLLIGLVAWGVIHFMGEPPRPPSLRQPLVAEEIVADWKEIDLDLLSDQNLRLVQEPGAIMILFGSDLAGNRRMYKDRADVDKVQQLVQALRDSFREPMSDGTGAELKDALLRAGLDPPRFHLTIRDGKGTEVALGFGNADPMGQGILARSFHDGTMFRTSPQVANLLSFNLRDWRDRTVFTQDPLAVTRIDIVRLSGQAGPGGGAPDPNGAPEVLTVQREGSQNWQILSPRALAADASACQSLAHRISQLRIESFVGQALTETVRKATKLPDEPAWSLQVTSGTRSEAIDVGLFLPGQGFTCRMALRDENMVFTVTKETLEPILQTTVDSLRPKRLYPRIETLLVGLECRAADGQTVLWRAEREGQNPRGNWFVKAPFEARANDGKGGKSGKDGRGSGSFAQIVVDVDRVEVLEFLPAGTPFVPEGSVTLHWYVQRSPTSLVANRTLEIMRDPAKSRTIVRDARQPDELYAVSDRFAALLGLDLELYRDRTIFPGKEQFQPRLVHWKLEVPGREPLEVVKHGANPPEPAGSTPTNLSPILQSAPSDLLGSLCAGYVRAKSVLEDPERPEPRDPFAKVAFMLTLGTPALDGSGVADETLIVQGSGPDAPDGLYCKLTPRLPDDVWMIVPRGLLEPLFRIAQK